MAKYDTWEKEKDLENAREVVEKFKERIITEVRRLSQTSFSLYLHNQWTDFHKLSCAGKPQMRAICTYMGCTKATIND